MKKNYKMPVCLLLLCLLCLFNTQSVMAEEVPDATSHEENSSVSDNSIPNEGLSISVQPTDISGIAGMSTAFWCGSETAKCYEWQVYNTEMSAYETVGLIREGDGVIKKNVAGHDFKLEITRQAAGWISSCSVEKLDMKEDTGTSVKCIVSLADKELESNIAVLEVIPDGFTELLINPMDTLTAGEIINSKDISAGLKYPDGTVRFMKGLKELKFYVVTDIKTSTKNNKDGSVSDIVETVSREMESYTVKLGSNDIKLRLRRDDSFLESSLSILGTDNEAPEIMKAELTPFEAIKSDREEIEPKTVAVTALAKDNYTPDEKLLYALLESGNKPIEKDYSSEKVFAMQVTKNTEYTLYVKDESGNVTTSRIQVNVIDNTGPGIEKINYDASSAWLKENIVTITATDNFSKELTYCMKKDGETTEVWQAETEFAVTDNGRYLVLVRDGAGNISEKKLKIENIDNEAPTFITFTTVDID